MKTKEIRAELRKLSVEAVDKSGTKGGEEARNRFEIYKAEIELRRNGYLFWVSVFLAVIALTNVIVQILKFQSDK